MTTAIQREERQKAELVASTLDYLARKASLPAIKGIRRHENTVEFVDSFSGQPFRLTVQAL